MTNAQSLINTNKYPIFDLSSRKAEEFFTSCRNTYRKQGALALPGFILPTTLERMAKGAAAVEHLSFKQEKHHNVYLLDDDPAFDENHPRNRQLTTTNSTISYADIQPDAPLRALYHCKELHHFIAHVTGKSGIYPYVDALSPLNIGVSRPGETLAWHFDTSDFATTLLLQAPEDGGAFEYIPRTRDEANPAYDRVGKLLDGDHNGVEILTAEPGTLALFQGRHAIHRVAPVKGHKTRMIAILTYDEKPDQQMNSFTQKKFYGRAA
jgi:hypothetical protein